VSYVLAFLGFASLIILHEFGHFAAAKAVGMRVERFSLFFGPMLWKVRRGETEYGIGPIPLGGYVKITGMNPNEDIPPEAVPRAYYNQTVWRRVVVILAGPAMNFVFAFLVYATLFAAVGVELPSNAPRVGGVSPGLPAEQVGLQAGDRIVSVDDQPIETWEALSKAVLDSKGARLRLVVERDGAQFPIEVTPALQDTRTMFGEDAGQVYRIGIEASHEWSRVGPLTAVGMAAEQTWTASAVVLKGLALMLQGRVPLRELGGPIAIARAAGQQARAGARYFLSMLAFLSINLGVLNLLPIPALDGGHLAFFGVEGLLRRPLRARHREIAQQVGLLLLITLMVFVFYNDIHRLVQG